MSLEYVTLLARLFGFSDNKSDTPSIPRFFFLSGLMDPLGGCEKRSCLGVEMYWVIWQEIGVGRRLFEFKVETIRW